MQFDEIVKLRGEVDAFILADSRWFKGLSSDIRCPMCGTLKREKYPLSMDAYVQGILPSISMGQVSILGLGVMKKQLFQELGMDAIGFAVGNCIGPDGQVIPDYLTWYSRDYITLRGEAGSSYRRCAMCGFLFEDAEGDPYVLTQDCADRPVLQNENGDAYIIPALADAIDWRKYPDITLFRFPIRDVPRDGFPVRLGDDLPKYVGRGTYGYDPSEVRLDESEKAGEA